MQGINWCVQNKRKPKKNLSSRQRKHNRRQLSLPDNASMFYVAA